MEKYSVEVPGSINDNALDGVLVYVEEILLAKCEIEELRMVRTDSKAAAELLRNVFAGVNGNHPQKKERKPLSAWTVIETGEKMATQRLNKLLRKSGIALGTQLHHPKHGIQVVSLGTNGHYVLEGCDEPEA